MAVETLKKVAVQYQLEVGRDPEGNMKYSTQTFQYIGKNSYDADKVLTVIDALKSVLADDVGAVLSVKTNAVSSS